MCFFLFAVIIIIIIAIKKKKCFDSAQWTSETPKISPTFLELGVVVVVELCLALQLAQLSASAWQVNSENLCSVEQQTLNSFKKNEDEWKECSSVCDSSRESRVPPSLPGLVPPRCLLGMPTFPAGPQAQTEPEGGRVPQTQRARCRRGGGRGGGERAGDGRSPEVSPGPR